MELKIYLVRKKISITEFSKVLGCSRGHLNGVVNGKMRAGSALAKLIEIKTNGEVTAEEVLAEYKEK
jgi:DNA-binding transcriptional regulator YdaS (Cro superfamily)